MLLTVTLNPAIDQVLVVDRFVAGSDIPASQAVTCVGGKGLDVSVALRGFGVETTGLTLLAGANGCELQGILEEYGIVTAPVWVEGEIRICYVIAETESGAVTHIKHGGITPKPQDYQELVEELERLCQGAQWVICAGSLPGNADPSIYAEYIERARAHGCKTLIDCSGEPFRRGLAAHPEIAKMNRNEFQETFPAITHSLTDLSPTTLTPVVRQVALEYDLDCFVVTCGADGILAVTPEASFIARAPVQQAYNAAGAGDAVSAALCWQMSSGKTFQEALHFAAAAGAAAVLTLATGECNADDVYRILPNVEVSTRRW
ncbi:MAG: hypothetical protein B6D39_08025 [Anaerolineae bacterium UTCFX2]|jgi:1-phosphofructokinase family hexose kinase|nr:hexose kinase [Anaerolineae bacterium]OQY90481.1 MAG: hypothetical protein B6D39_08025 [Anaerolineae bacterium UTCFX2]